MLESEAKQKLNRETYFGEIKFFKSDKNYGFITECESGDDFFFLRKDVALKNEDILSHLPVSFSLKDDVDPKTGIEIKRAVLVKEVKF